ncbi:MAG: zinc ribbon domain-containing protein [Planctomycetes bacterium]|nr:zinc ribbon domain-containing protein [Planctomycetota bacterium]
MPTYDYVCDGCDHRFEQFQSMNDSALKKCPKCNKSKLRRLIGAGAGIIFKGSGFYITDYKKSGSSGSNSDSPSSTPNSSPSSSGADKSCGSCGKTGPNVCD